MCMIAKPEPCLRPLGCSHRSWPAPPCAAHLLTDSFQRKPSECQVNGLHRRLSQMGHDVYLLDPLARSTFTFSTAAFHLILSPFTSLTCLFHSLSVLWHRSRSSDPLPRSLLFILCAQACHMVAASPLTGKSDGFHLRCCLDFLSLKANK